MSTSSHLSAANFGLGYVVALGTILALDGLWLGLIAKAFYRREMGTLMRQKVSVLPAVVFYLLYPAALVYLCLWLEPSGWAEVLSRGAVLGAAAYGAYDLTNLAVVKGWPVRLSVIDWAWGTLLSVAAAGMAAYAFAWLGNS